MAWGRCGEALLPLLLLLLVDAPLLQLLLLVDVALLLLLLRGGGSGTETASPLGFRSVGRCAWLLTWRCRQMRGFRVLGMGF